MSYLIKREVLIKPVEGQRIVRNCSKCGGKATYINTENFRVNANGNAVDVWLIYQCEKCKTTYNLSVYERVRPKSIQREEYDRYMRNDKDLAWKVSYTPSILKANHVEVDSSGVNYELVVREENSGELDWNEVQESQILIENPYQLRIRFDRILSEMLGLSRTEVKRNYENGTLEQVLDNPDKEGNLVVTINKAYVYKQVTFRYKRNER